METTNLEESPAGLSRADIIAPIDLLSKCNLVHDQSALMPESFVEKLQIETRITTHT